MIHQKYDYRSGNSVQKLFLKLSQPVIQRIAKKVYHLGKAKGLTYVDEHAKTVRINLTLRPRLLDAKKQAFLWRAMQTLNGAFQKIAPLYFRTHSLNELFPFSPREHSWLRAMNDPHYTPAPLATRWDANTTFSDEDWRKGCSFFEVNGVGVGGVWYQHAAAQVALDTTVPELQKIDPSFRPVHGPDMRRLLLGLLLRQRRKLGLKRGVIALAMEKASGSNYVEFERLAKFYRGLGISTTVTEPTDFYLKRDELFARGKKIDLMYRDTTLSELCAMEEAGHPMRAVKEAFRRGQVISSLEGEFDHKSVFEVFTDDRYANAFTQKERAYFEYFILWTRLLREIKTQNPKRKTVDLIPFVLSHQNALVLKPNRLYGGKGVLFGREVKRSAWRKKIDSALDQPGEWVIQELGDLREKSFCVLEGKKVRQKEFYVVSGFFATPEGLAVVGRMSERTVVNVARRGGLTPILLIR